MDASQLESYTKVMKSDLRDSEVVHTFRLGESPAEDLSLRSALLLTTS
jgi:hypothetical protein